VASTVGGGGSRQQCHGYWYPAVWRSAGQVFPLRV